MGEYVMCMYVHERENHLNRSSPFIYRCLIIKVDFAYHFFDDDVDGDYDDDGGGDGAR